MLNAELKSMNSNLTYKSFLSRCVRAGWRAVAMASSVERLDLYAYWKGSREGGRTDLMCGMTSRSKHLHLHLHLVIWQTLLSKATYNWGIHKAIHLEEAIRQRKCS